MDARDRLIIALDFSHAEKAIEFVDLIEDRCRFYKVGSELFTTDGHFVIQELNKRKKNVFLDLKFHDIPHTVGAVSRVCARMDVKIFNVHASGGLEMMREAKKTSLEEAGKSGKKPPLILAVTVLTSITSEVLKKEMKVSLTAKRQVIHLAKMAQSAGLDGVVCSPFEIKDIKRSCGSGFIVLTPGVRPSWSEAGDQKRFKTPKEAFEDGADYLVIGRPVTKSLEPVASLEKILQEMQ
jgi:orotidine-5'-phosphate decarboxylase